MQERLNEKNDSRFGRIIPSIAGTLVLGSLEVWLRRLGFLDCVILPSTYSCMIVESIEMDIGGICRTDCAFDNSPYIEKRDKTALEEL